MSIPLQSQKIGVLYALGAFGFWGLVPIYFKAIQSVPALETVSHRVVWSVPFLALLITLNRDWRVLRKALSVRKVLGTLFISAVLMATSWFVFIYSVITDRVLQASIGYFIIPIINVLLGVIFLRERLRPWQALAVLLAAVGTFNLTFHYGKLPWISLTLAFSFSIYGLLRKTVSIESVNGLFFETTLLFPLALVYLLFLYRSRIIFFGAADPRTTILLALAGLVTSLPLLLFLNAARRLPYSTIGLLQYLTPSLHFVLAVLFFHEPFNRVYLFTFGCIWAGLAIYITGSLSPRRKSLLKKISVDELPDKAYEKSTTIP
ncbi:MAG: EamA family transporter RarD [Pseudomonadota bacterium]